jgi:hypothetical protein
MPSSVPGQGRYTQGSVLKLKLTLASRRSDKRTPVTGSDRSQHTPEAEAQSHENDIASQTEGRKGIGYNSAQRSGLVGLRQVRLEWKLQR